MATAHDSESKNAQQTALGWQILDSIQCERVPFTNWPSHRDLHAFELLRHSAREKCVRRKKRRIMSKWTSHFLHNYIFVVMRALFNCLSLCFSPVDCVNCATRCHFSFTHSMQINVEIFAKHFGWIWMCDRTWFVFCGHISKATPSEHKT